MSKIPKCVYESTKMDDIVTVKATIATGNESMPKLDARAIKDLKILQVSFESGEIDKETFERHSNLIRSEGGRFVWYWNDEKCTEEEFLKLQKEANEKNGKQ